MAVKSVCLALLAVSASLLLAPGAQAAGDFVQVSSGGTGFSTSSCPNFAFSGYNTWQPIEAAAGLLGTSNNVGDQFDAAVANDLQVVRMFGFSVQQGINNQYSPGVYNESMLVAFDNVIADADKRNLKLIIALANNWDYNGNMSDCKCWYTNQSKTATNCDDFFSDATCIDDYLLNAKNIMTRVNTVTKLAYNNDPTIMAWDLINEGRCDGGSGSTCTAADIQAWTAKVAPVVKGYAPKQLVTIGQDGFWQADNCASNTLNPVPNSDGWPLKTGQNFLSNHDVNGIDYTSVHLWPDNWDRTDLDFGKAWINGHLTQSRLINKPLVLEEFGKAVGGSTGSGQTAAQQLGYYQLAYAIAEGSINSGDALRGIAFWRWDNVDPQAQLTGFDQEATITTSGNVFQQVVKPFSGRVSRRCPSAAGTPATSNAGRKLLQTGVPSTGSTTPATASPTTTENSRPSSSNNAAPAAGPAAARAAAPSSSSPAALSSGDTSPATANNANSLVTGSACQANLTVPGSANN